MSRPQDWILLRRTACWSCLTDCIGRGIRWCSSHTMSEQRSAPQGGCILKTDAFSGEIIRHRIIGALEPHRRFTLSGRRVFRLNQAGTCADAARAHKRVDTYGFHPLVNHPFPLASLAQTRDRRPLRKGERQRIFSTVGKHSVLPCRDIFAVSDSVLLHRSEGLSRRNITVLRNPLARCNAQHLRIYPFGVIYLRRNCP